MSQMSDLATILDDMTQTGKALIECGESLIKAAAYTCHRGKRPSPV
jgi:hypothetical protein